MKVGRDGEYVVGTVLRESEQRFLNAITGAREKTIKEEGGSSQGRALREESWMSTTRKQTTQKKDGKKTTDDYLEGRDENGRGKGT